MSKLIYISPLRYPSEKAGSLFSAKSCEVFADQGVLAELWVPRRVNMLRHNDPFEYFGVKRNFKIRRFPVIDFTGTIPGGFSVMSYTFALSVFVYALYLKINGKISDYIFYSHEQFALLGLTLLSKRTFYEMHDFPSHKSTYRILFRRIRGTVSTNRWKSEEIVKRFVLPNEKVHTVPNAVDIDKFSNAPSKLDARKTLGLDPDAYIVGYVGALKTMGMEKGIDILIDSLKLLPAQYKLYLVGGSSADVVSYGSYIEKKGLKDRVIFAGHVNHGEISIHMSACDCLVAPYPNTEHYSHYMSPMKVFEYMASKRPMVVTDLPSIVEILGDNKNALYVIPDDSGAISEAVSHLFGDPKLSEDLVRSAFETVQKYTWEARAKTILSFIQMSETK